MEQEPKQPVSADLRERVRYLIDKSLEYEHLPLLIKNSGSFSDSPNSIRGSEALIVLQQFLDTTTDA